MKSVILKTVAAAVLCAGSVSAFAVTNYTLTNSASNEPSVTGWTASNNGANISKTSVGYWNGSGIGVGTDPYSRDYPQHSLDNYSGFEVAMLSFDEAIRLETVTANWWQNDSDIFVLAYTGAGTPTNAAGTSLTGGTFSNLTSSGWTLIGNYSNIGTNTVNLGTTSGTFENTYSSFWLIGAGGFAAGSGVNSGDVRNGSTVGFNTCSGSGGSKVCGKYDYVKVASVGGTIKPPTPPSNVSEPGSLALAGLALVGMMGLRRRKQA